MPDTQQMDTKTVKEMLESMCKIKKEAEESKRKYFFAYIIISLSFAIVIAFFVGIYILKNEHVKWDSFWLLAVVFIAWCCLVLGLSHILSRRQDDF